MSTLAHETSVSSKSDWREGGNVTRIAVYGKPGTSLKKGQEVHFNGYTYRLVNDVEFTGTGETITLGRRISK